MLLVIGVGHGFLIGEHPGLGHGADEHAVGIQIHIPLHLEGHHGVNIPPQESQPVIRAQHAFPGEFIHAASALEAEALKHAEGRVHRQAVKVHRAGLADNVVGVILLVDAYGDAVGRVGHLGYGVDDEAVIPLSVVGGDDIQPAADFK